VLYPLSYGRVVGVNPNVNLRQSASCAASPTELASPATSIRSHFTKPPLTRISFIGSSSETSSLHLVERDAERSCGPHQGTSDHSQKRCCTTAASRWQSIQSSPRPLSRCCCTNTTTSSCATGATADPARCRPDARRAETRSAPLLHHRRRRAPRILVPSCWYFPMSSWMRQPFWIRKDASLADAPRTLTTLRLNCRE
jgi:hypothetical protein